MALDLTSLEKAVDSLDRAIKVADKAIKGEVNTDQEEVIRAGVIQNFEFTYELCWKFMKRWIETQVSPGLAEGKARRELFRLAAESLLIADVDEWMRYHEARNMTSHVYDTANAAKVFESASAFIHDAKRFLRTLQEKND